MPRFRPNGNAASAAEVGLLPKLRNTEAKIHSPSAPLHRPSVRRILTLLIAFYLLIVLIQANIKLLWVDELITYYIARQPGLHGIWQALRLGADPNPPLLHILVQFSTATLGASALAMRLPSILAVLLAIGALWSILCRWLPPLYAASGVLAFMATRGFDYAFDARSYALLMGFALAALALWLRADAVTGLRRAITLAGMTLCLAAGLSSNYFGVLAFFPIALGELTSLRPQNWVPHVWPLRRGFDHLERLRAPFTMELHPNINGSTPNFRPSVWISLLLAAIPLYFYLPLIRHNISEFTPHAWNRPRLNMIGLSYFELVEGPLWLVLFLAAFSIWKRIRPLPQSSSRFLTKADDACRQSGSSTIHLPISSNPTLPDVIAIATLLLYPILGYAIALGGAGMISPRCVVPVCCGFGIAFAILAHRVFGPTRRAALITVLVLTVAVTLRELICANVLMEQRQAFFALRDTVAAQSPGPILVADSSFVLPLYFYSSSSVRNRILVPIDFEAIHLYETDDSGEQNLWAGRNGIFPFPIVPFSTIHLTPDINVIARPEGWLATSIRQSGLPLQPDPNQTTEWSRTGGVFTPMSHFETRILHPTSR